ncbi:hypothetical protein HDV01_006793 [Terramyces sp. JEL0728]|nr:hypothetical protein HDV01_006793 [Terramyces sp. JEL0728]
MPLQLAATGFGLNKSRIAFTDSSTQLNEETDAKPSLKKQTKSQVKEILTSALQTGSKEEYQEALLLEKYRDALLAQARELQGDFQVDLDVRWRKIAPKVYGWSDKAIPGISSNYRTINEYQEMDYEEIWGNLRSLAAHEYNLEDPEVATEFFDDLKDMMLGSNIKKVKPEIIHKNYPWLEKRKLFQSEICCKSIIKKPNTKVKPRDPNKISIAKQRFADDVKKKEMELQTIMNEKFHANPIPASSMLPK